MFSSARLALRRAASLGAGARMRATARDLQARVVKAFGPDGGSVNNFHKFVDTCLTVGRDMHLNARGNHPM
uniref:Uncharacterized protein n=1 Tax=Zea mays TaxID=4577 RepID=B6TQ33_MAIZE|nr:hypothetical protein [Zea mays]